MDIGTPLPTYTQAAKLMQPREGTLNDPSGFPQATTVGGIAARQLRQDMMHAQPGTVFLRIIAPVTLHHLGATTRSAPFALDGRNGLYQRLQLSDVMRVGTGQNHGQGNALAIRDDVVLTAFFRTIRGIGARLCPPKTARTEALSTTARLQSIASCWPKRSKNTCQIFSQRPVDCHACKRRQHVIPEPHPNSLGSISQGIPERNTKIMPVSTARSAIRGRPPLGRAGSVGNNGAMVCHNSSLKSGFGIGISSKRKYLLGHSCSYINLRFC